jgi:hypothetical protein
MNLCNVRYKILVQEDSVYNIFHDSAMSIYKMMVDWHQNNLNMKQKLQNMGIQNCVKE